MADIYVSKINAVWAHVKCDSGIAHELYEHFTYYVDGYQWSPKYKYGQWDGKIHEFQLSKHLIRAGLYVKLKEFAKENNYTFEDDGSFGYTEFSIAEAKEFIETLNLPEQYQIRDYQLKAFVTCVREGRDIQISPTASGKSLIIYLVARYYGLKTLIVVPTIGLVAQMSGDFKDYGYEEDIHQIQGGVTKYSKCEITVSTWQSLHKESADYFDQYEVIIGDEVHLFAASSLKGIMDKAKNAHYRFGFTGTLSESKTNETCLIGLFGKIHQVTTTSELMEQGHIANFRIKGLLLKYPEHVRLKNKNRSYHDEVKFLITLPERNKFIRNLICSLEGNTLVLFRHIEHGKFMFEETKKKLEKTDRKVFYIAGSSDTEERESVRKIIETETDAIIFGSRGTMSTGSNTKSLHNLVFASPSKSKISTLQSIGRSLRKSKTKEAAILYDIADDLHWKSKFNYTLDHFKERVRIYLEEKFKFKLYEIDLNVKEEYKS